MDVWEVMRPEPEELHPYADDAFSTTAIPNENLLRYVGQIPQPAETIVHLEEGFAGTDFP